MMNFVDVIESSLQKIHHGDGENIGENDYNDAETMTKMNQGQNYELLGNSSVSLTVSAYRKT